MVRNVVVGRLREGHALEELKGPLAAIVALDPPGLLDVRVGTDLRLRGEGSWDFAITSDFEDEAAYRAYDAEEQHNRIRREGFAPICAEIVRVQIPV